jgi:glycosyltransferase involved in cell wall biosynthesis
VEEAAQGAAIQAGARASGTATAALNRGFERLFARLRHDAPDVVSQHAFDVAAIELAEGLPVIHTLHMPPIDDAMVRAARASRAQLATVSGAARRAWRAADVERVMLLRNGVPDFATSGAPVAPVALIAGRISPEKGTDTAIRVARRGGLAPLVVGDAYDAGYFTRSVRPLLRDGEWIGAVTRRERFELMARSALLIMPVHGDEAFGLVAAEAQMAGCPVVAYRRGALSEVVEHGLGGWLVDPGDEDGLVRAIAAVRGLNRAAIRRRARRRLGIDQMLDDYERAFAQLISGSAALRQTA